MLLGNPPHTFDASRKEERKEHLGVFVVLFRLVVCVCVVSFWDRFGPGPASSLFNYIIFYQPCDWCKYIIGPSSVNVSFFMPVFSMFCLNHSQPPVASERTHCQPCQGPTSRLMIRQIVLENFKSYGGVKVGQMGGLEIRFLDISATGSHGVAKMDCVISSYQCILTLSQLTTY